MPRTVSSSALAALALLMAGCGGSVSDDKPALAPVKGKAVYNGQPVANALVQFSPQGAGPSSGKTNDQGEFTLMYRDGEPGAAIGEHQVTVSAGGPTPDQQAALDASANGDRSVKIPTDIAPLVTFTAKATVKEGENDLTLNVERAAGAGGGPRNSAER